jgi:hypothetical protein
MKLFRCFSSKSVVSHSGLELRANVDYPVEVKSLVEMIKASPRTNLLVSSLGEIDVPRKGALLVRYFAIRDDLGNAFRVVHALKMLGEDVDRETYRYLMLGCCKYEDIDLGLFVMEQMLYDNRPDFRSFKRLFDACASAVDLRLWIAHDVMMWFYPLKGFGQNALRTTGYITELMKRLGLRQSSRAGRGFVTLPHYRGDPYDPFLGMFEEDDPNYEHLPQDSEAGARLKLISEEFQDRNRLAKIMARHRAVTAGKDVDEHHLTVLEGSQWSRQALLTVIKEEEKEEQTNLGKMKKGIEEARELENQPIPSLKKSLSDAWKRKKARD